MRPPLTTALVVPSSDGSPGAHFHAPTSDFAGPLTGSGLFMPARMPASVVTAASALRSGHVV